MPPGHDERRMYRNFWDQFSGKADNTAMMLNANADQIEALDRADILAHLPPVKDKFVVDIGAGIGRFTTVFAQSGAARVVSTDFVDTFVAKNRERNGTFANVKWRVGDALGLEFEQNSIDLVFTNWLLMYMGDEESVQFVANALRWLRHGGHLHLRESCSEPSTKKSAENKNGSSLHNSDQANPTRYRFSSVYINLLRNIRHIDADTGKVWRFDVQWAFSVGVYIERQLNWRQVHWLARKVPADKNDPEIPFGELSRLFAESWPSEQKQWDRRLEQQKPEWMESAMEQSLLGMELPIDAIVFGFSGRRSFTEFGVDVQELSKDFECRIWAVERDPFAYRHSLTQANRQGDRRVRLAWHQNLESALDFWERNDEKSGEKPKKEGTFDAIVGTEMLAEIHENAKETVDKIARVLAHGGQLVSLEVVEPGKKGNDQFRAKVDLLRSHFLVDRVSLLETLPSGQWLFAVRAHLRSKGADEPERNGTRRLMGGF